MYIFSCIDRQVFNMPVGPVRRDLHVVDTQMSLLIGIAFAVFQGGKKHTVGEGRSIARNGTASEGKSIAA